MFFQPTDPTDCVHCVLFVLSGWFSTNPSAVRSSVAARGLRATKPLSLPNSVAWSVAS